MPSFMHSFKSPFSPNKKNGAVTPVEVVAPAEPTSVAPEQPSSEILPGEVLVQQTSSTVALTLTPANGESSQQVALDDAELVSPSVEPTVESVLPVEPESVSEETTPSAELTEGVKPEEAPADVEETASPEATPESQDALETSAPEVVQEVEPTTETEIVEPTVEPVSDVVESAQEVPSVEVAEQPLNVEVVSAPTDAEVVKPAAKANKDSFSCNVKRNKSKKQKAETSTEATEAGQTASAKPRKSNPLADKFRSVIEQVKSKVKKDKESASSPPAVVTADPTPIVEEVAASA